MYRTLFSVIAISTFLGGCAVKLPQTTSAESDVLGEPLQLTTGYTRAGEAYFSHDSKWLVFQATEPGEQHYQMYMAKVKYQNKAIVGLEPAVRVSPEQSRNTCGWFSPDNTTLLFASTAGKEDPSESTPGYQRQGSRYQWAYPKGMEIYAMPLGDSAGSTSPARFTAEAMAGKRLTDNDAYDAECAYSPDGRQIVFTSNRTGDLELFVMHSDGSNVRQLTTTKGYDGGPFFSNDGQRLVYRSDRQGNDLLQVFVADVVRDGNGYVTAITNERQLTTGADVNWGPYFHPNGAIVFYASSKVAHTNYEIFAVPTAGGEPVRITYTAGADVLPVVSPDGRYLLWSAKRSADNTTQLYVAPLKLKK